jgi:hypothetical protein
VESFLLIQFHLAQAVEQESIARAGVQTAPHHVKSVQQADM